MLSRRSLLVAVIAVVLGAGPALAQAPRGDIRDLKLGLNLETMPEEGYYQFACGTNGGPPRKALDGWAGFRTCAPEATGLYEVYVEYDDEWSFLGRMDPDLRQTWVEKFSGTKVAGHPVILSVLFNGDGVVHGIRAVTDPRVDLDQRRVAYHLRTKIFGRFGRGEWECVDLPPAEGQTDVGGEFIKQHCTKIYRGNRRIVVYTQFFRKPGQTGFDAAGQWEPGQYESSTRLEILDLSVPLAELPG